MSTAHTTESTQYGLQFPAGGIKWATGSATFEDTHKIPGDLVRVNVANEGGYDVDLADAKNGGHHLSHLLGHLRKNCEAIGADPAPYVKGCRIVSRKVLVVVSEQDPVPLPEYGDDGEPVPDVYTAKYSDAEPDHGATLEDSQGDKWTWDSGTERWVSSAASVGHTWASMYRHWFPMQVTTTK